MPFIPPVPITRLRSVSVPPASGRDRSVSGSSSAGKITLNKTAHDDKSRSVKDRLTSNLKQFGKNQPRSRLPTGKSSVGLRQEGRNPWLPSQRMTYTLPRGSSGSRSFPASNSRESVTQRSSGGSQDSPRGSPVKSDPEPEREEARFTLMLTPEAVLLLQRRNAERHRSLSASSYTGTLVDPARRRKEHNVVRQPPGPRGCSIPSSKTGDNGVSTVDVSSMVKISLLNERYKYDDVEYEEEESALDEKVVLKCTEWLRGLESAPVALCHLDKGASLKSF